MNLLHILNDLILEFGFETKIYDYYNLIQITDPGHYHVYIKNSNIRVTTIIKAVNQNPDVAFGFDLKDLMILNINNPDSIAHFKQWLSELKDQI